MIVKVIKKPVTVECVQWDGNNFEEIKEFCGQIEVPMENCPYNNFVNVAYLSNKLSQDTLSHKYCNFKGVLYIRTLEGDHKAIIGDYIIKGVHGECYPCKRDIFEETYDIVDMNFEEKLINDKIKELDENWLIRTSNQDSKRYIAKKHLIKELNDRIQNTNY